MIGGFSLSSRTQKSIPFINGMRNTSIKSLSTPSYWNFDGVHLISVLTLVGMGIVIIYSSSGAYAENKGLPTTFYLISHLKKVCLGLFALAVGMFIPYRFWFRTARPIHFVVLALLVYLVVFAGVSGSGVRSVYGASRWVFGLQPSEFAKISLVFFLSRWLVEKQEVIHQLKAGTMHALTYVALYFGLLLLQPDYSSGLILMSFSLVMIFLAGSKLSHLGLLAIGAIPALIAFVWNSPYRLRRVLAFLNPEENAASAYQSIQSLISLGSGGLTGTGLGTSTQKLGYLPMPFTDTIFGILGEELGFVGTTLCIGLFGLVLWRGFQISFRARDRFSSLVAAGFTTVMGVTVVMHIGVCGNFFPTTGQPLPFVSFGGTALCTMLFSVGVVLNISRYSNSKEVL
jgi:cell division protein FtsW